MQNSRIYYFKGSINLILFEESPLKVPTERAFCFLSLLSTVTFSDWFLSRQHLQIHVDILPRYGKMQV